MKKYLMILSLILAFTTSAEDNNEEKNAKSVFMLSTGTVFRPDDQNSAPQLSGIKLDLFLDFTANSPQSNMAGPNGQVLIVELDTQILKNSGRLALEEKIISFSNNSHGPSFSMSMKLADFEADIGGQDEVSYFKHGSFIGFGFGLSNDQEYINLDLGLGLALAGMYQKIEGQNEIGDFRLYTIPCAEFDSRLKTFVKANAKACIDFFNGVSELDASLSLSPIAEAPVWFFGSLRALNNYAEQGGLPVRRKDTVELSTGIEYQF